MSKKVLKFSQTYRTAEESYSPFFSNIGLQIDENFGGVQGLFLHYNRFTRTVWENLISVPEKYNRKLSTPQKIVFGNGEGMLSFYEKDSFLFEYKCEKGIEILSNPSDKLKSFRVYDEGENTVIIKGYSANGDGRDPDKTVPISAGIKVLCGKIKSDDKKFFVVPDENMIRFAFSFDVLDVDVDNMKSKLSSAPCCGEEAVKVCENWMENCIGNFNLDFSDETERKLVEKALHSLTFNLTYGPGNLRGYVSAYPNRGTYPTHFLWDSCFQNLAYEEMNMDLAKDSLYLFGSNQRSDGKIPQFSCSTWCRPHDTQPALAGWASLRIAERTGDMDFVKKMLPVLEKNNRWWLSQRLTENGLIQCDDGLETGQDDSPRFDNGTVIAVDMNSYLLNQMRATAKLYGMISDREKSSFWEKEADKLGKQMIKYMFDEKNCIFFDVNVETGEKYPLVTSSCFLPLWAGVPIEKENAVRMIEKYLLSPEYLYGDIPFPSVAYNQPPYEAEHWWRGPTWLPVAWLMMEVLEKYGYEKEKMKAAERLYNMIFNDGEMHELFNSLTGEGLGSVEQGWTCAIFLKLFNIMKK